MCTKFVGGIWGLPQKILERYTAVEAYLSAYSILVAVVMFVHLIPIETCSQYITYAGNYNHILVVYLNFLL